MNQKIIIFAEIVEQLQAKTGYTLKAKGGAYGSSRLVIVDQKGEEFDYQEALEGGQNVQTDEGES
jgi:hypothetical protein